MNAQQYRDACTKLGMSLNKAAKFLGVGLSTSHRWANEGCPEAPKTRTSHPKLDRNHAATTHDCARTSPLTMSMLQPIDQARTPQFKTQ
jgi:transposase